MTLLDPEAPTTGPLFADALGRYGERAALLTATGQVSYTELDSRVAGVAAALGTTRRLVLIAADNTIASVTAYLGALRGGHPVLLAPGSGDGALRNLTTAYDPDVVIDGANGGRLRERRRGTAHDLSPDLALLLSTSGSTGSSKLVRLSHDNLQSNAASIAGYLGLTAADRGTTSLPMHYCYGLSVINSHLLVGAGIVLTKLSVVDQCFWRLFETAGATNLAGVPHTFDLLDRVGFASMTLPTLRYVTQAGGHMRADSVRRYAELGANKGWQLFVMYGQTEATARMAYLPPELARSHPHTVGVPIPGGSLTIEEPDAAGVGELVYRGRNVMLGYAEGPRDLALGATIGALHTGDLARATPDGLFEIVGRRSRVIKPYGIRVDLDHIETLLAEHEIAGACTGDDDDLIVAVDRVELADAASEIVVRSVAVPRSCVRAIVVDELPRLTNGKHDYIALARKATSQDRSNVPTSDRRRALRATYAEVLGVDPSDTDTFVSLGGDSLSYVEMSVRLEQQLGDLPSDWHTTPLCKLDPVSRRSRPVTARTDTTAVLRAVSIVLIVGTHAGLWQLPGGAHALIAIAGYNFARFQLGGSTAFASIARVALPSVCWIAMVAALGGTYGWPNALLLNGIIERPGDQWGYWFIEALVFILVPVALLFRVPVMARLERQQPVAVASVAIMLGLVIRFDVIGASTTYRTSRPHHVFWLFAIGWAAARCSTIPQRALLSAATAWAVSGFFGDTHRELLVLGAILLFVWRPTVPVPRPLQHVVSVVAGASLYIYLTHFQVFPPVARVAGIAVSVAGSVAAGIAVAWVARRGIERVERLFRAVDPPASLKTCSA